MKPATYGLLVGGMWVAWVIYWYVAARGVKPIVRTEDGASRFVYWAVLFVGIAIMVSPRVLLGDWFGQPLWPRQGIEGPVGLLLMVAGLSYSIWARVHLAGNWSGHVTVKQDHELIRSGPYAWTRHPIYTGLLTAMLASVVMIDRRQALFAYGLIIASFVIKLRREERFMQDQFGDAYQLYKKEVAALVPGLF